MDSSSSAAIPRRLLNKDFVLLWQGQFISQLGNQAHAIAMMYWLMRATDSAGIMGLIMMLTMIPGVVLGPLGGTLADRSSRKRIIVWSDALCGLAVISLAVMMFTLPEAVDLTVVWLGAVGVFLTIVSAVFRPAISAAIPDLVPKEKLAAANSFNQSSSQVAGLVGQGVGGILFRVLGAPMLFLFDGISYIVSAFFASFIHIPQTLPEKTKGARETLRAFRRDTIEGFRYVWQRKGLRTLLFTAAFLNFFISPFAVLLPFYIEDHLHATPDWFGYFLAAIGGGAMIGLAVAGAVKIAGRIRMVLVISMLVLDALTIGSLGLASTPMAALIIGLFIGMFNAAVSINIATILQLATPGHIRGRVFAVLGTIAGGLTPVGMGLAGVVTDLVNQNIPAMFIGSGLIVAFCTLMVSFSREFRNFLAFEPDTSPN